MGELPKIASCPFCGAAPSGVPQNSDIRNVAGGWLTFVWCENCDAKGGNRDTDEKAIAAWNRRAPIDTGKETVA